jgi:hypothetical protein
MKKNTAILYICTGKYIIFLKSFYNSAKKYLLKHHNITYFVFTDAPIPKAFKKHNNLIFIPQKQLGWPHDTLNRFDLFYSIREKLEKYDYIYFFNANLRVNCEIGDEILPENENQIVVCKHPGFFHKKRQDFPYENNINSAAYVPDNKGEFYFAGGLNGGTSTSYIKLINNLRTAILDDSSRNIIAKWHDESHLNRYVIDHESVKTLSPAYLYPEGAKLPFENKITILNKKYYGGHSLLRNQNKKQYSLKYFKYKTIYLIRNYFSNIF